MTKINKDTIVTYSGRAREFLKAKCDLSHSQGLQLICRTLYNRSYEECIENEVISGSTHNERSTIRIGFNDHLMVCTQDRELVAIYDTYNAGFLDAEYQTIRIWAKFMGLNLDNPASYSDKPAEVPEWFHTKLSDTKAEEKSPVNLGTEEVKGIIAQLLENPQGTEAIYIATTGNVDSGFAVGIQGAMKLVPVEGWYLYKDEFKFSNETLHYPLHIVYGEDDGHTFTQLKAKGQWNALISADGHSEGITLEELVETYLKECNKKGPMTVYGLPKDYKVK